MSNPGAPTVAVALREAAAALSTVSDTARLDAELLMAHALGESRSDLLLRHMAGAVPEGFASLLARRLLAEPVAYILGEQEFFGLPFRVTSDVLIPRGDSEVLVEAALAHGAAAPRVLDCGTGSGCLLLAVLHSLPGAVGVGIDRSAPALAIELAAVFLRTESELVLKSRRVVPARLLDAGFEFEFPEWLEAAEDLVRQWRQRDDR